MFPIKFRCFNPLATSFLGGFWTNSIPFPHGYVGALAAIGFPKFTSFTIDAVSLRFRNG